MLSGIQVEIVSREERTRIFGLDCGDGLEWHNWLPGGEHVKKLLIKNVSTQTQKLKYKLPQTKYFGMEYPETIVLSAGTSCSIKVTFRPIEMYPYEDVIPITTPRGIFYIPVRATLPSLKMLITEQINFGCCAVQEVVTQRLDVTNAGEVPFEYSVSVETPFIVTPSRGSLQPRESVALQATFVPPNAASFSATAIVQAGGISRTVFMSGVGKYPFIVVDQALEFGDLIVGRTRSKAVAVRNYSSVKCKFTIRRVESDCDPRFSFSAMVGALEPNEEMAIQVVYSAVTAGTYSADTYEVVTHGGNTVLVRCCGNAVGAKVSVSPESVNFGSIEVGKDTVRVLTLSNGADEPAPFQFSNALDGVLALDPPQGIIPSQGSINIRVIFSPHDPIVYYKRVICLLKTVPLCVDILGTAYDETQRPAPLSQRHVDAYYARRAAGDGDIFSPPEMLDAIEDRELPNPSFDPFEFFFYQCAHSANIPVNTLVSAGDGTLLDNQYDNGLFGVKEVEILEDYLDFGACSRSYNIAPKTIRIINRTKGKVTCCWPTQNQNKLDPVFSVIPVIVDIDPHSIQTFQVRFCPPLDNQFYGTTLSCYVYYKTMRNFRLVTEKSIVPSWCITTAVAGHTFEAGRETFLPRMELGSRRINFPPCRIGGATYQVSSIVNTGDTALAYKFEFQSTNFLCNPSKGILHPGASHLIVFRFQPSTPTTYRQVVKCILNNSTANIIPIALIASAATPAISLENDGKLYFRPTCVGTATTRNYMIHNPARIPVSFTWRVPTDFSRVIHIEPMEGLLKGNEAMPLLCTFAPLKSKHYRVKISCLVSDGTSPSSTEVRLTVIGEGAIGEIIMEPRVLNFGNVLVNENTRRNITLKNPTGCAVQYILEWQCTDGITEDLYQNEEPALDSIKPILEVSPSMGSVPAYSAGMRIFDVKQTNLSQVNVSVYLQAPRRTLFSFRVLCHLQYDLAANVVGRLPETSQNTCEILACGVYPLLSVTDIRAEHLNRIALWERCEINKLNAELSTTLSPFERRVHEGHAQISSIDTSATSSSNLASFVFDFGGAAVGTAPTRILLQFTNVGSLETSWQFAFPDELEAHSKREAWVAVSETLSVSERHRQKLLENKIFRIKPSTGILPPGESTRVEFIYYHMHGSIGLDLGKDEVPVLLSIAGGKQVVIKLCGHTLSPSHFYIHFHSILHTFTPLPIGLKQPPIQTYTLYNEGATEVSFNFDTTQLKTIQQENYNFSIIECLTESGIIPPGGQFTTFWRFTPLEDREYVCKVPIVVQGGPTTIFTLRAQGYHPHHSQLPNVPSMEERHSPPAQPALILANQPVKLSLEIISLGNVPIYSNTYRIVVLSNLTNVATSFSWDLTSISMSSIVKIEPESGILAPNAKQICRVIFSPQCVASFEFAIPCHFIWEQFYSHLRMEHKHTPATEVFALQGQQSIQGKNAMLPPIVNHLPQLQPMASITSHSPISSQSNAYLFVQALSIPKVNHKQTSRILFHDEQLPTKYSTSTSETKDTIEESNIVQAIVVSMLNDILSEAEISSITQTSNNYTTIPYFVQLIEDSKHQQIDPTDDTQAQVLQSTNFKNIAEFILDATLFNLMNEALHNEFIIGEVPPLVIPTELQK